MHTTEWDRTALRDTLDAIMERADLSQAAVGRLAGRDRTMANRWLTGKHQPAYEAAARFAAAITEQRPDLADLAQQFMAASGYGDRIAGDTTSLLPSLEASAVGASDVLRRAVADLRDRAQAEGRPFTELLVEEGIVSPDELVVPDSLRPDPMIEEINASSDLSDGTKIALIRAHLENRARRFEEVRTKGKELDD
ncbi:helix-turn-helix domain-containing protein [Streptosporangium sp. DT93]|uniref:helix-turn-helix domain-containing protein n=1 Tax=Streptosporangium sp. DT93 TaxID=3393428 RepID=UPI003CECF831